MNATDQNRAVLLTAAEILTPEGHWCQGWYAHNSAGEEVMADDPNACDWCMEGALEIASAKVAPDDPHGAYCQVHDFLWDRLNQSPASFNDGHSQTEVVAALLAAAEVS